MCLAEIKRVYNPELTLKENYNSEVIQGMKISFRTFNNYLKRIKEEKRNNL